MPADWYPPIAQQAVILSASTAAGQAREFLSFLTGDSSRAIIAANGYATPPANPAHE